VTFGEAISTGAANNMLCERRVSRAAVLRSTEQTRLLSANDDEVGGVQSAMREQSTKETAWLDQPDLGRLSERTLGGSSPPATCGDQITKDPAENEPQKFRGKSATLRPPRFTRRLSNLVGASSFDQRDQRSLDG
jgi:hypothetical protein